MESNNNFLVFLNNINKNEKNKNNKNIVLDEIIRLKRIDLLPSFVEHFKDFPIEEICDKICATKDPEFIYYSIGTLRFKNINMNKIVDVICDIGEPKFLIAFAGDFDPIPVDKLAKAISKTKNPKYIYDFVSYVSNLDLEIIELLENSIIETQNAEYIYKFACDSPTNSLNKFIDAIVKTKNPIYTYYFIKFLSTKYPDVLKKELNKFVDALLETNDIYYIECFIEDLTLLDIDLISKKIILAKYIKYKIQLEKQEKNIIPMLKKKN